MATEPSGQRVDGGPAGRQGARSGTRRPPSRGRRKARMVHRVVRHVEVWSVAKVAAAFAGCGYVIGMISGYLLWRAADRVGTIDGIEGFLEDTGAYDGGFQILGDVVFQATAVGFAVLSMLFVALAVLGAVLFNLISDLTGGIRMTAIDEDLIVTPARRPSPSASGSQRPGAPATPTPDPRSEPPPATDRHDPVPDPEPERERIPARAAAATEPTTATEPAAAPRRDPWKMPAPNETWTTPADERANGSDGRSDSEPGARSVAEPASESIGLGSADNVV